VFYFIGGGRISVETDNNVTKRIYKTQLLSDRYLCCFPIIPFIHPLIILPSTSQMEKNKKSISSYIVTVTEVKPKKC